MCGTWTACVYVEHVSDGVYRSVDDPSFEYVRTERDCDVDEPGSCWEWCDAEGNRFDGLLPNPGVCTVSGPPVPAPFRCEREGGICVEVPVECPPL